MLPDPPKRSSFFGMRGCHGGAARQWPSERAEKIWRTVHEGQEAALKVLETTNASSVVYAADVDRAARDVLASAGYGQYFTHRVGHGVLFPPHLLLDRLPSNGRYRTTSARYGFPAGPLHSR